MKVPSLTLKPVAFPLCLLKAVSIPHWLHGRWSTYYLTVTVPVSITEILSSCIRLCNHWHFCFSLYDYVSSHPLLYTNKMYILCVSLQNIFHMVVEVPRWTNAKMEVQVLSSTIWWQTRSLDQSALISRDNFLFRLPQKTFWTLLSKMLRRATWGLLPTFSRIKATFGTTEPFLRFASVKSCTFAVLDIWVNYCVFWLIQLLCFMFFVWISDLGRSRTQRCRYWLLWWQRPHRRLWNRQQGMTAAGDFTVFFLCPADSFAHHRLLREKTGINCPKLNLKAKSPNRCAPAVTSSGWRCSASSPWSTRARLIGKWLQSMWTTPKPTTSTVRTSSTLLQPSWWAASFNLVIFPLHSLSAFQTLLMSSAWNLAIWKPPLTGSGGTKYPTENQRTSLLSTGSSKTRSAPNIPCFANIWDEDEWLDIGHVSTCTCWEDIYSQRINSSWYPPQT